MAQTLMQQLVKHEGYCCIYKYFHEHRNVNHFTIAYRLGVEPGTILKWKKKVESGEISCGYGASGLDGCLYK